MLVKALANALLDEFSKTEIAYTDYLEGGQTYRFACVLWLSNERILQIITDYSNHFDEEQQENMQAIAAHLEVWRECWRTLDATADFKKNDRFVFQNKHRFPREQANAFIDYLKELRS